MSASRSAPPSLASWLASGLGRLVLALAVPGLTFLGLWQGFLFLRDSDAPKLLIALVAIIWGVGGAGLLYLVSNWLVEQLPAEWVRRLQPFLFIGPAMAILIWFLALPTLRTLWISLFNANSSVFVGLQNYLDVLTQQSMLDVFRNNLLWMVLGTSFTVVFGLLVAVLAEFGRASCRERV